jgi:hypothetical protein
MYIYIYVCYVSVTIQIQMQNLTELLHFRPDGLLRCNEHRGPQRFHYTRKVCCGWSGMWSDELGIL